MVVSYFTIEYTETSTVRYGTSSKNYTQEARGYANNYLKSDDDDVVFFNHHVLIQSLQPSTQYFYRVGDANGGFSEEYNFTTAPPQAQSTSAKILVYGDMGISNSQHTIERIRERVRSKDINFIFHVGDISYADDYNSGMYEAVWNAWFTEMEDILPFTPYMVTPGNHEYSCEHAGCGYSDNFTAYNHRFRMPGNESSSNTSMFYSFNYANVHFIAVSTETDYPNAPEGKHTFGDQLLWLERDLRKANKMRDQYPWIVVGGHRPIYSSSIGFEKDGKPIKEAADLQKAMEDLFVKYKVDLFVVGHVHSYERMFPTIHNVRISTNYDNPQAPTYIVVGCAGNTEGLDTHWEPKPEWSATRFSQDYGYGIMHVFQESQNNILKWSFYQSGTNKLTDEISIMKPM